MLINCTFAAGFVALSPGPNWDYSAALYHCVVTATTVGYGDMLLRTQVTSNPCLHPRNRVRRSEIVQPLYQSPCVLQAGRVLAIFHILISTSWIASVLSHLSTKYQQRKTQLWHAEHLRMQLHPELLRSLLQGGIEEGGSIDKLHFVLGMLTNLKIVTWDDVMPFLEVCPRGVSPSTLCSGPAHCTPTRPPICNARSRPVAPSLPLRFGTLRGPHQP